MSLLIGKVLSTKTTCVRLLTSAYLERMKSVDLWMGVMNLKEFTGAKN